MISPTSPSGERLSLGLRDLLTRQQAAQQVEGAPSAAIRRDRLDRCVSLLVEHRSALEAAVSADFGVRPAETTGIADIAPAIGALKHAKAHLDRWMRPERRPVTPGLLGLFGARAEVRFQPKGVVGVISPWNFPVLLAFGPLAGVLAAGNRAMLKPSEHTPETSALLARLIGEAFAPEELAVVTGGPEVAQAFTALPFDHLVFTGSTAVGREVMRAAAENLTPVTLELGGKSPALVSRSADMTAAADRIMAGKALNAGQVCLAPDYVLAPEDRLDAFVEAAGAAVGRMFPTLKDNPDYASLIGQRHYDRLRAHLDDARGKGARIVELNPAGERFEQQQHFKLPPTLVLDPTDDMTVMQEEIFGPVLPVKTYRDVAEAVAYVNAHPRPLGLYWFGDDAGERERVLAQTISGGVTINDVIFHIAQEALPFGGTGPSGMGAYHGRDGFLEFSHRRAVFSQVKRDLGPMKALRPPYGEGARKYLDQQIRR